MVLLWEEWHTKTKPRKHHCGSWHRPFPNSKNSPFQNKATWENEFYLPRNNGFALSLALKQRLGATRTRPVRKWDWYFEGTAIQFKGIFSTKRFDHNIRKLLNYSCILLDPTIPCRCLLSLHCSKPWRNTWRYKVPSLTPPPPYPLIPKKRVEAFCDATCVHHEKGILSLGTKERKNKIINLSFYHNINLLEL